jgi:Arc/MetJ family transcription regulator
MDRAPLRIARLIQRPAASRRRLPYAYGTIVWMKKTLHIDERLLRDAKSASGAKTDTDTVRLGLEALVRHGAYQRLRALRGAEPKALEVPRRRERLSSTKHSAV